MPQMGWPSVVFKPARCPEQAGVIASWLRTSRDRDDLSICKAASPGGAASPTPGQGGVTATWPLASREQAYPSISAAASSGTDAVQLAAAGKAGIRGNQSSEKDSLLTVHQNYSSPVLGCSPTGADCDNRPGAPPATTGPSAGDTRHPESGHSGRYVDTGADCDNRGVSTEIVQARYFVNLVFGTFPLFPSAVLSIWAISRFFLPKECSSAQPHDHNAGFTCTCDGQGSEDGRQLCLAAINRLRAKPGVRQIRGDPLPEDHRR